MDAAKRDQVTAIDAVDQEAASARQAPLLIAAGERQVAGRVIDPLTIVAVPRRLGVIGRRNGLGHAAAYLTGCWTATGSNGSETGL